MRLLEALDQLQATQLFCIGYAWMDKTFVELKGNTVVDAADPETALKHFQSKNKHIHRAWIITIEEAA